MNVAVGVAHLVCVVGEISEMLSRVENVDGYV